ncbi:MAG: acyl carrier protein [Oscillospiraceae bacterium]|nr:acyl carrier protein [Oscillospiraceae bacterium]
MVFDKVKELIADQLSVDEDKVVEDANIQDDLGADSLDIVDLIGVIEDEYDLEISDETVQTLKTVGDIVKYIEDNQ